MNELRSHHVRATGDYGSDPMKAKIANAEQAKFHTMLVIGGRDMEAGAVSVRLHGKGNVGAKPMGEVVAGKRSRGPREISGRSEMRVVN